MPDTASNTLGDLASPISLGLGTLETGINLISSIGAKKKINKLLGQRQAYKTPDEINQILQATENNASQGFDPTTLNYLTTQTDQAFSSSTAAAERLGADPNTLSAIFGQKVDNIMKIGSENHQLQMANFSQYINALGTVAENKTAEQKSQQDILKDKLQAAGADLTTNASNINSGLNTVLSTLSTDKIAGLYNPDGTLKNPFKVSNNTSTVGSIPVQNNNPNMVNSTSYIDPNTPNLIPNYVNPFRI